MRLAKPPVIELWIEFQYALKEEQPEWTIDKARELIKKCFGEKFFAEAYRARTDFMMVDPNIEGEVQVQTQTSIDRIRATTKEKDRYLQAGKNVLVYNVVRTEKEWPDFKNIKPEAIDAAEKFREFMKLVNLESVSLHYRDVVKIPLDKNNRIALQDYFTIYPESPDDDWAVSSGFSVALTFPNLSVNTIAKLVIETDPTFVEERENGERYGCLRMDWHATSNTNLDNKIDVERWLNQAHDGLLTAFRKAFTDKGFNLFEPQEN